MLSGTVEPTFLPIQFRRGGSLLQATTLNSPHKGPKPVRLGRFALSEEFIFSPISPGTDFGTLLALRHEKKPSVILLRQLGQRRPDRQLTFLLANVNQVAEVLREGAVAVFEETRTRMRQLPIDLAIEESTEP